jgi:hypothetical protein
LTRLSKIGAAFAALLIFSGAQAAPPPRPYHIELEANTAAPFPYLTKFGTITVHVYPAGVRAESIWLNGFSRLGTPTVTIENPYGRMYTTMPVSEITTTIHKLKKESDIASVPPPIAPPVSGKVRGIPASRYRLLYGPDAWIDVWTTDVIPENAQLRNIVNAFVGGVSPSTAASWKTIPGTPLYVELNFQHYKKLPLIRLKSFAMNNLGQEEALKVGSLYFRAPFLESIWK